MQVKGEWRFGRARLGGCYGIMTTGLPRKP